MKFVFLSIILILMVIFIPAGHSDVVYFSDFEANDGGLIGTLDWEWNSYAWTGAGCTGTNYPPPAAYSGSYMWGTVVNGCYSNLGNNTGYGTCINGNPSDDSILSLTVDLSGLTYATLSFYEWMDLYLNWDWGEIYANGNVIYQHCGTGFTIPTDWQHVMLDLTPYAGGTVTLEFHMMASSVVEHAGWYIDDLLIEDIQMPTATPTPVTTDTPIPTETPDVTPTPTGQPNPELACPASSIFSHYVEYASEYQNAFTSDIDAGYWRYDNYSVGDPICNVTFWGIKADYDSAWYPCTESPMPFLIEFYPDDGTGYPDLTGGPAATYSLDLPGTDTGEMFFSDFPVYRFEASLSPCCNLMDGWVSIVGNGGDTECWLLWMDAHHGDLLDSNSKRWDGSIWVDDANDLAFCLNTEFGTPSPTPTCGIDCPPGAMLEGEPPCGNGYVDNYNGGCNSTPWIFQPIDCGDIVCGEAGTYDRTRDTDWYEVTVDTACTLTWTITAAFPSQVAILQATVDCNTVILDSSQGDYCETHSCNATVVPGTYWLWAGTSDYNGWPCVLPYVAEVNCITGTATPGTPTATPYGTATPTPLPGDTCDNPFIVPQVPFLTTGTTTGFNNDYDEVCPYSGSTAPDVVYLYSSTEVQTVDIDLCYSQYDTKVYVYEGACGYLLACNDDFYVGPPCGQYVSKLEDVPFAAGTDYYIVVDGYGSNSGEYTLAIGFETTPTPASTDTPVYTNTPVITPTRTPTPVPPTWTPTNTPTASPPTNTPTNTPTAVPPTWTPTPTATVPPPPTDTPVPEPTNTPPPEPTATPVCTELGCTLYMPSNDFTGGMICYCDVTVCNPGNDTYPQVPLFVLLDVYGMYFFAPSFTEYDYYQMDIPPGKTVIHVLEEFPWPSNVGSATGIRWYAAMTDAAITELFGEYDMFEFGWH